MAYTQAMVDRSNVALPRQHYHQAPYSPHGPSNPSWSQTPATPPRVLGSSNGRAYSPSATRTPQMIKCSTCACLVPLLELSEHICNPEASAVAPPLSQRRPMQTRQYSADAHHSGSSHSPYTSNGSQPRFAPHPLRLNVSHASGSLPSGPGELVFQFWFGIHTNPQVTCSIGLPYIHPSSAYARVAVAVSSTYALEPVAPVRLHPLRLCIRFRQRRFAFPSLALSKEPK
jgi:hypothetical protein